MPNPIFLIRKQCDTHINVMRGGGVMGWEGGLYRIRFILYFIAEAEASEVTVG